MWVLWVDVAAAAIGLSILSGIGLSLYRRIKRVGATLSEASAVIAELTDAVATIGPPTSKSAKPR